MLSASGETGQLVDLAEEKVYDINFESKSYKGDDLRGAAAPDA
jgi:hypothetical protein